MKKHIIYQLGIIYQSKVANNDMTLSDTRFFRDSFKNYLEHAVQIEKDRQEILKKEISDDEKRKEFEILFNETIPLEKLSNDVLEKIETLGIKISIDNLNILEEATK